MTERVVQEPCPKCGTVHTRGPYERNDSTTPAKMMPRDVQCQCGLTLRWSVPIFMLTDSGYVLRILRDDEAPFLKDPE